MFGSRPSRSYSRLGKLHELDMTLRRQAGGVGRPMSKYSAMPMRRLEKDQQQPALGRFGRAPEWHDDDHRDAHRPFGGKKTLTEGLVGEARALSSCVANCAALDRRVRQLQQDSAPTMARGAQPQPLRAVSTGVTSAPPTTGTPLSV